MRNINDVMPKLPPNSWGAVLNWIPEKIEIDNMTVKSPLPFDSKWHRITKIPGHREIIVDDKVIRQVDDEKLK